MEKQNLFCSDSILDRVNRTKMKIQKSRFTTNMISNIIVPAIHCQLPPVATKSSPQSRKILLLCCKVRRDAVKRRKCRNTFWTMLVLKANTAILLLHNLVGSYEFLVFVLFFFAVIRFHSFDTVFFFSELRHKQMHNAFARNVAGKSVKSSATKWVPINRRIAAKTRVYCIVRRVFCWRNWFMPNHCTITRISFWTKCMNAPRKWIFSWWSFTNFWIQEKKWFWCPPRLTRKQ